jgi:hypothetical protein
MIHLPKTSDFLYDPIETPAGLIVPARSIEHLVKSEAKKMQKEDNKASFFSTYALAQNMVAYGAREKPQGTPQFTILYEAAKQSFVDSILIRARIDQQKRIWQQANEGKSKEVGFRVVHKRHDDKNYKVTKGDQERCREMEELLSDPTPEPYIDIYPQKVRPHTGLKDLVGILTRAELIIDRKVLLRYKRRDGQGYSAFHWLPGESVKNVDEAIRAWAQKNEKNQKDDGFRMERASQASGFDLARCSHVQLIDGQITAAFLPDEISVHISNPSDQLNRFGYGESRLELSLDITTTLLMAWTYNREMFKTNYPEQILTVSGDYDKEGLAAFKQQILAEAGGIGSNWRLPVIPSGDKDGFEVKSVKLRESPKDMLFDQMIELAINLKAAAYGAHPSTLNLAVYAGTSGQNGLGGHNPSDEIEFSKERGLIPSLTDMCEWLTYAIIKPRYDDLKLILVGMNPEDEKETVDIRTSRVSKWMTKNEARIQEGEAPLGFYLQAEQYSKLADGHPDKERYDTNPWNYPADVPIANYLNTFSMLDQAQQDPGDEEDDQGNDMQKSQRPRGGREKKYLSITIS